MKKQFYKGLYKLSEKGIKVCSCFPLGRVKKEAESCGMIEGYERKPLYIDTTFWDVPICDREYDLSLIVPVYNAEPYLERCLRSLCCQKTHYQYQILCIDDGSTDGSPAILESYRRQFDNLFVIRQENGGISNARNHGIRASSGRYLGFVDNDDWVREDYVEKLLYKAEETGADIVKCNHVNFSAEEKVATGVIRHDPSVVDGFGLEILEYKGYVWGGIIRRSLFDKIRFPEGYWYEDIIMRFTLMRLAKRFAYLDEELYFYLLHRNNSSKTLWKKNARKTLDFYYLLVDLCAVNGQLGIGYDVVFYNQLVYELGANLWLRTRRMPTAFRKTLFLYACELAEHFYRETFTTYYGSNVFLSKALLQRNYSLWRMTAFHIICGVHIDYVA